MFEKKVCGNCGEKIRTECKYCPNCGEYAERGEKTFDDMNRYFKDMFHGVDKEFERIDKLFSQTAKSPKVTFRLPGGGGISVTIVSSSGMKPKVNVKTYGNYKQLEPEIKRKLVPVGGHEMQEERTVNHRETPRITEEPAIDMKDAGAKTIVRLKLPGVKNKDDIEIRKLEQSIEVRAFAGDKAYFKLIPMTGKHIHNDEFKDGILTFEISKR